MNITRAILPPVFFDTLAALMDPNGPEARTLRAERTGRRDERARIYFGERRAVRRHARSVLKNTSGDPRTVPLIEEHPPQYEALWAMAKRHEGPAQ